MPRKPQGASGRRQRAAPTYNVGYGMPPEEHKYKVGHPPCGGRPKKQRDVAGVMDKVLDQRVKIREGNRIRSVTKREAICQGLADDAVLRKPKALANLIAWMRFAEQVKPSEPPRQQPRTATDEPVTAEAEAATGSSPPVLTEEFLGRLSGPALDEFIRVWTELEAEKRNSKTIH